MGELSDRKLTYAYETRLGLNHTDTPEELEDPQVENTQEILEDLDLAALGMGEFFGKALRF